MCVCLCVCARASRWLTTKEQRRAAGGTVTRKRQPEPCSLLHSSSSAPTAHARAHRVCEGVNLAHFSKQHPLHNVVSFLNEPSHFTEEFQFFSVNFASNWHLCLSGAVFRSHWPQGRWCVITEWPLAALFLIPAPPSQCATAPLLAVTCMHAHRSLAKLRRLAGLWFRRIVKTLQRYFLWILEVHLCGNCRIFNILSSRT